RRSPEEACIPGKRRLVVGDRDSSEEKIDLQYCLRCRLLAVKTIVDTFVRQMMLHQEVEDKPVELVGDLHIKQMRHAWQNDHSRRGDRLRQEFGLLLDFGDVTGTHDDQ